MSGLVTPETMREHRATWFAYVGRERIPFQRTMRGTWGYDATCTCGWDNKTGGATRGSVRNALDDHRLDAQHAKQIDAEMLGAGLDPANTTDRLRYLSAKLLRC